MPNDSNAPPMTDKPAAISAEIEHHTVNLLRNFVRGAAGAIIQMPSYALEGHGRNMWRLGEDGHFRKQQRQLVVWSLDSERLRSLPGYAECKEQLEADPVIGPHMNRSVGTNRARMPLSAANVLELLTYRFLEDAIEWKGTVAHVDAFDRVWFSVANFFEGSQVDYVTVAPMPGLSLPEYPLRLTDTMTLDRFTELEVEKCALVGLLEMFGAGIVGSGMAVGVRIVQPAEKIIRRHDEPEADLPTAEEGEFGRRPPGRSDLAIDDVLLTMRLLKAAKVQSPGLATWTNAPFIDYGAAFSFGGDRLPWGFDYELSETEVPSFVALWQLLGRVADRLHFSLHRFNLAFERRLLADRLVDLVISAEALLLSDVDSKDRGELRFRFSLRASQLIPHASYTRKQVYKFMRTAYDARSSIVHGSTPTDLTSPDGTKVPLDNFVDTLENLLRPGLRRALDITDRGTALHKAQFWESLLFGESEVQPSGISPKH